jgi:hypothetical protein
MTQLIKKAEKELDESCSPTQKVDKVEDDTCSSTQPIKALENTKDHISIKPNTTIYMATDEQFNKNGEREYFLQKEDGTTIGWLPGSQIPWAKVNLTKMNKRSKSVLADELAKSLTAFRDTLIAKPAYSLTSAKEAAKGMLGWDSVIIQSHVVKKAMQELISKAKSTAELTGVLTSVLDDWNNIMRGAF